MTHTGNEILVLGGTGKTGRRLVPRLRAAGQRVRAASRSGEVRFDWEQPATWQAAVVVGSVALAVCVVLAAAGRLTVREPSDLLVPLAGSAIVSSLAPLGHTWLSDWIGWAIPLGVVALLVLLLGALTPLDLAPASPLVLGAVALAGVGIFMLYQPLTIALHPPPDMLPLRDDSEVRIVTPEDGAIVEAGELPITVEVTGGSIGPVTSELEELTVDPEEGGSLAVFVDGDRVPVEWDGCTVVEPCGSVDIEVPVTPGDRRLVVEFVRGDGTPFAPTVVDRVTITAE
jgi:hypothetical protein